jgi:hypothetical protein
MLHSFGWQRFIVCVDADGPDAAPRHKVILAQVIKKAQVPSETCVLVPVQELEAWILADIEQVSEVIAPGARLLSQNLKASRARRSISDDLAVIP